MPAGYLTQNMCCVLMQYNYFNFLFNTNSCFKRRGRVRGGHCHGEGFQTRRGHAYDGYQHFQPGTEKMELASPLTCLPHDVDPLGALASNDPG